MGTAISKVTQDLARNASRTRDSLKMPSKSFHFVPFPAMNQKLSKGCVRSRLKNFFLRPPSAGRSDPGGRPPGRHAESTAPGARWRSLNPGSAHPAFAPANRTPYLAPPGSKLTRLRLFSKKLSLWPGKRHSRRHRQLGPPLLVRRRAHSPQRGAKRFRISPKGDERAWVRRTLQAKGERKVKALKWVLQKGLCAECGKEMPLKYSELDRKTPPTDLRSKTHSLSMPNAIKLGRRETNTRSFLSHEFAPPMPLATRPNRLTADRTRSCGAELMDAWARHCECATGGKVVAFKRRRRQRRALVGPPALPYIGQCRRSF